MAELHGWAGASAQRQAAQRGRIPGAGRDGAAWAKGAEGEVAVGRVLGSIPGVLVLHDRAVPGSPANIDHVAVAPSGVYVIDAKHYAGTPRLRVVEHGVRIETLRIGGTDRSDLVASARRQLGIVAEAVGDAAVPVRAVLCFVGAEWDGPHGFLVDGVGVLSPEALGLLLASPGPLTVERVTAVHARLGARLAAAWDG